MVTLTGDIAGKTGLIPMNINNVDYVEYVRKHGRVIFHVGKEKYYAVGKGTLKYWVGILNATGYKFMIVDRNNAVHLNNIKVLDEIFKKAYFEYDIEDKANSGCTMSWDKYNAVKELIGVYSPNAQIVTSL